MTGADVKAGTPSRTAPVSSGRRGGPSAGAGQGCVLHLDRLDAVLFDLDGVLTGTASLHQAAWTAVFTELFERAGAISGQRPAPFTAGDYLLLAGGEPRLDAVRNMLASRHLTLPEGTPDDGPGFASMQAVAAAKDARFATLLADAGPRPFPGSARLLRRLRAAGLATAVVSASRHCAEVLSAAGLEGLADVVVDGKAAAAMGLAGKPDPACYLEAARRLGVSPGRAAIIDDAVAGVAAGRRGGFGLVAGVGRGDHAASLAEAGADVVGGGLSGIGLAGPGPLADGWHLAYRPAGRAVRAGEGMRETLCTLGNGYLGVRGARLESRDDGVHYPGTYLAGVYDRLRSDIAGRRAEHESIVNAPSWLPLSFSAAGGPWLGEAGAAVSDEELRLDLRAGVLVRRFRVSDPAGRRTRVAERRLVSMAGPHLAGAEVVLVAENWAGTLRVRSGIDGTCCTDQTAEERLLSHCHLVLTGSGEDPPGRVWLAARTVQSGITVAVAARTAVAGAGGPGRFRAAGREAGHEWAVELAEGASCRVEKAVAVYTSKDRAICEPAGAARQAAADAPGFGELLAAHEAAWARLWSRARTEVEAEGRPAGVVNLHLFHLLQVASPHVADIDAGLGARGLHGEGYLGHVFWDELFVFRFLNLRFPETSRALLRYRHRRLPAARRLARQAGEQGARFPWQSGSDGRDETPALLYNPRSGRWMPDRSAAQRHVGLAVAYNCWRYFEATGDETFLLDAGAEIIFEVARHFAYLASYDEALGRWRIRGVMGPDEFHDGYPWAEEPGVDDNAYTNVLASWLLTRAEELAGMLARDQREDALGRLGIGPADLARFGQVARGLHVPFHDGVISQFAGYERLEPIDLDAYRARHASIGRLDLILEAEGDTIRRYQAGKQADTLMLFYLFSPAELRGTFARLGYELSDECVRATIAYYSARVTDGSTLSRVVHAWVTARADRAGSWRDFTEALAADMADTQGGTTGEGIHLGAMAGTIDLLQRCYTGLQTRGGTLIFDPVLPGEITGLRLALAYRGHRLDVRIGHDEIAVASAPCQAAPVTLNLAGKQMTLRPGGRASRRLPRPPAGQRRQPHAGHHDRHSRLTPAGTSPQPGTSPVTGFPPRQKEEAMATTTDPVCGMAIEESAAAGSVTHEGKTYYFCSSACQGRFEADPGQYASRDS